MKLLEIVSIFFRFSTGLELYKGIFRRWDVSEVEMKEKESKSKKTDASLGNEAEEKRVGVQKVIHQQGLVGLFRNCLEHQRYHALDSPPPACSVLFLRR